jgi:hypothetical protein
MFAVGVIGVLILVAGQELAGMVAVSGVIAARLISDGGRR